MQSNGTLALLPKRVNDSSPDPGSDYVRLAQWIKRGRMYPHVHEINDAVLYRASVPAHTMSLPRNNFNAVYGAGALGYAIVGKLGDPDAAVDRWEKEVTARSGNVVEAVAAILEVSADAIMPIYAAGIRHKVPADTIVSWLTADRPNL